jgi:hypothetical protein
MQVFCSFDIGHPVVSVHELPAGASVAVHTPKAIRSCSRSFLVAVMQAASTTASAGSSTRVLDDVLQARSLAHHQLVHDISYGGVSFIAGGSHSNGCTRGRRVCLVLQSPAVSSSRP